MKIIKRIIIGLLVIIALVVVVAYLLPRTFNAERSILINTDDSTAFYCACSMKNGDFWEEKSSSTVVYEIIGGCETGAIQRWEGESMRNGEMILTEVAPFEKLRWDVEFEGVSEKTSYIVTFKNEGDDILVTWTIEGDLGYNPTLRYMGLMMDDIWGPQLEKGLQNLKKLCEN
jgi:hypothetical protein